MEAKGLKLRANNFTGILPTGERYKVNVTYSKDTGFLTAWLYREDIGVFWTKDIVHSLVAEGYRTYKEALAEILTKIGSRNNVELIKKEEDEHE